MACGACHGEIVGFLGMASSYPRIPGHEIAGVVDALGEGVQRFKVGDRVGVGWFGKQCFECGSCRGGDFITCAKEETIGLHYDGGYAEYATVPQESVARIPAGMDYKQAAPLMCAGKEVFQRWELWCFFHVAGVFFSPFLLLGVAFPLCDRELSDMHSEISLGRK